jgi:hypothetical protein
MTPKKIDCVPLAVTLSTTAVTGCSTICVLPKR